MAFLFVLGVCLLGSCMLLAVCVPCVHFLRACRRGQDTAEALVRWYGR